jgi:predicted nucleotidyltransferase
VEKLGVFGSTARGENSPDSDLDLLVEFRPGEATFDHYMHLKFFIEDRLGMKADVVTANALRKEYKEKVLEETIYVGE